MNPPLHGSDENINSTQSADANVNEEVSSAACSDANTNANIKFMRIIRECGCGCGYSLHLLSEVLISKPFKKFQCYELYYKT